MKSLLFISISLLLTFSLMGQTTNPNLDSTLAKSLGADDYGMKKYVLVILKTGNNKTTNKQFVDSCFSGHLANIVKLAETQQLIVAGPFGKNNDDFRGLFILNVTSMVEANKLLETDPAIKANLLIADVYPWYGSAAIPEYLNTHNKIWKIKP